MNIITPEEYWQLQYRQMLQGDKVSLISLSQLREDAGPFADDIVISQVTDTARTGLLVTLNLLTKHGHGIYCHANGMLWCDSVHDWWLLPLGELLAVPSDPTDIWLSCGLYAGYLQCWNRQRLTESQVAASDTDGSVVDGQLLDRIAANWSLGEVRTSVLDWTELTSRTTYDLLAYKQDSAFFWQQLLSAQV